MDEKMPKLYFCDPSKNFLCRKGSCFKKGGPCSHTTNISFVDVDKEAKEAELRREHGPLYQFLKKEGK